MKPSAERVFLDAKVLFSAAYGSPGLQGLWDLAAKGLCQLYSSAYAIEEARLNLDRQEQLARLEGLLARVTILPEADPQIPCPVSLSPQARPILLAAIQARTTHLVTGELRHFRAYWGQVIGGVAICTPPDYLSRRHLA